MNYLHASLCFGNIWRTDVFLNVVDAFQGVHITITCSNTVEPSDVFTYLERLASFQTQIFFVYNNM